MLCGSTSCAPWGCGKLLPNSRVLDVYLIKSHLSQDGTVNPPRRRGVKIISKFDYCPVERYPRDPDRPFSQLFLLKQHLRKMNAKNKHECGKCSNLYGHSCNPKRHAEDYKKIFWYMCGCRYASRTVLQLHIYCMSCEIPAERRDPLIISRQVENYLQHQKFSTNTTKSLSIQPNP